MIASCPRRLQSPSRMSSFRQKRQYLSALRPEGSAAAFARLPSNVAPPRFIPTGSVTSNWSLLIARSDIGRTVGFCHCSATIVDDSLSHEQQLRPSKFSTGIPCKAQLISSLSSRTNKHVSSSEAVELQLSTGRSAHTPVDLFWGYLHSLPTTPSPQLIQFGDTSCTLLSSAHYFCLGTWVKPLARCRFSNVLSACTG